MDAACYVAMYINYNVEPCAQVDTGVKYKCIYIYAFYPATRLFIICCKFKKLHWINSFVCSEHSWCLIVLLSDFCFNAPDNSSSKQSHCMLCVTAPL